MLKRSIIEDVRFDYLLVDSWFTCSELLKFVVSRHFGCHLIGMIKMGKTKYEAGIGNKTAPELIKALQKFRNVKYSRSIGYYTATVSAKSPALRSVCSSTEEARTATGMLCLPLILNLMQKIPSDFIQEDGLSKWLTKR